MCPLRNIALKSVTDRRTDDGQSDPYMCRYASQATKKNNMPRSIDPRAYNLGRKRQIQNHFCCKAVNDTFVLFLFQAPLMSTSKMQLAPTSYTEVRTKTPRSFSRTPPARRTPESVRTAQTAPEVNIIYPSVLAENMNMNYDDISLLPPPKRILPKRELPWVFRYKVKRNMNELAKIMASKPGSTTTTPLPPELAAEQPA